jgi:hypothetical protein
VPGWKLEALLALALTVPVLPLGTLDLIHGDGFESGDASAWSGLAPCPVGTDSDADRLDDCVETHTGVFVDSGDTGTDPADPDSDADGLGDGDETLGSLAGLDLPAFGVSPLHQDILVEYDWFDDALGCGAHSHQPVAAMVARVTAAFAAAPVANPDGVSGIHVVHDYGQGGGPYTGGNYVPDANGALVGHVTGAEFIAIKAANLATERVGVFHYVLLPHQYDTSGSSGASERPGDDIIVSLGCSGTESYTAQTLMHELGHNLSLRHGGFEHCNFKPNYNSIMNYRYQFPGVDNNCTPPGDGVLDFSHGQRIDLDELDLDENVGICGASPWNWNGNGVLESSVSVDVNASDMAQPATCGGTLTMLADSNDWANLDLAAVALAGRHDEGSVEAVACDSRPPAP